MDTDRPRCKCHGLPKAKNGWKYGKQEWRCAVYNREHYRDYYDAMTGPQWNKHLLRIRRHKALARMKRRKEHGGQVPLEGLD